MRHVPVGGLVVGVQLRRLGHERVDAHGGEPFVGEIAAISPAGSEGTRTFRVELAIDTQDPAAQAAEILAAL